MPSSKEVSLAVEVPAGEIAVMSYHDKNDNLKMDTNWIGYRRRARPRQRRARRPAERAQVERRQGRGGGGAPVSLELSMWNP